jgi:hypothetical protein
MDLRVVCAIIQWNLQTHDYDCTLKMAEGHWSIHRRQGSPCLQHCFMSVPHLQALEAREAALTQAEDSLFSATQLQRELSDAK